MRRYIVLGAIAASVSGCTTVGGIPGAGTPVAVQALGTSAYSIDPNMGYRIRTPGIYAFHRDGSAFEICSNDVREQKTIKSLKTETEPHSDTLEDALTTWDLAVSIPGVGTVHNPTHKVRVEGYTITRLVSGDSRTAADYVLANVAKGCPAVLKANRPYMIVSAVAMAKKAQTVSKGMLDGAYAIGGASLTWSSPEIKSSERQDVTFGIAGKYVRK